MPIGENVRHLRELRGWTQEKLAEKCSVSRQHINGVENGHRPSMTLAAKLAKVLGSTLKEIV